MSDEPLAWSEFFLPSRLRGFPTLPLPQPVDAWAWRGSDGAGVRVAVLDSGVEADHPAVGPLGGAVVVEDDPTGQGRRVVARQHPDLVGHGTAIAGIIRGLAPACELWSVQVLGSNLKGRASALLAAIRWSVEEGFDVINLSLSTSNTAWFAPLHDALDDAYFAHCVAVGAVNNVFAPTYPSEFASVISVASSGRAGSPLAYNVEPPAEFGAPGEDVTVAWRNRGDAVVSGNSFAAAHVSGLAAQVRARFPGLSPFQVKAVLAAAAVNAHPVAQAGTGRETDVAERMREVSAGEQTRPRSPGQGVARHPEGPGADTEGVLVMAEQGMPQEQRDEEQVEGHGRFRGAVPQEPSGEDVAGDDVGGHGRARFAVPQEPSGEDAAAGDDIEGHGRIRM